MIRKIFSTTTLKFLCATLIFIGSASALAMAGDKGNGGDAVVCFKDVPSKKLVQKKIINNRNTSQPVDPLGEGLINKIDSVELLDLYMLRTNPGLQARQFHGSFQEIIDQQMAELAKKSNYTRVFKKRKKEIEFRPASYGVMELDDSGHVIYFPDNCLLIQLAFQDKVGEKRIVYYEERLFQKLPEVDKAALYFHEWLYRFAIDRKWGKSHKDSKSVREFIAILFSEEYQSMSGKTLAKRLEELNLEPLEFNIDYPRNVKMLGQDILAFKNERKIIGVQTVKNTPFGSIQVKGRYSKDKYSSVLAGEGYRYHFNLVSEIEYRGIRISSVVFNIGGNIGGSIFLESLNDVSLNGFIFKRNSKFLIDDKGQFIFARFFKSQNGEASASTPGLKFYTSENTTIQFVDIDYYTYEKKETARPEIESLYDYEVEISDLGIRCRNEGEATILKKRVSILNKKAIGSCESLIENKTGQKFATVQGLKVSSFKLYDSGRLKSGNLVSTTKIGNILCEPGEFVLYKQGQVMECNTKNTEEKIHGKKVSVEPKKGFYANGSLRFVNIRERNEIKVGKFTCLLGEHYRESDKKTYLHKNGQISNCKLSGNHQNIKIWYRNKNGKKKYAKVWMAHNLVFNSDRSFKSFDLYYGEKIGGKNYSDRETLHFDRKGYLIPKK